MSLPKMARDRSLNHSKATDGPKRVFSQGGIGISKLASRGSLRFAPMASVESIDVANMNLHNDSQLSQTFIQHPERTTSARSPRRMVKKLKSLRIFRGGNRRERGAALTTEQHKSAILRARDSIKDLDHCLSIENASQPDLDLLENIRLSQSSGTGLPNNDEKSNQSMYASGVTTLTSSIPIDIQASERTNEIRSFLHERPLTPDQFLFKKRIGYGSFGQVFLATYGTKKTVTQKDGSRLRLPPFAVKQIPKSNLLSNGRWKHAMREQFVLMSSNHPNIVSLYATFQDETCLYMVFEFLIGGELYSRIAQEREELDLTLGIGMMQCLPVDDARFYFAETYAAINSLHRRSVAYRDLKPENILIDIEGHLKLIDFGFAKPLPPASSSSSRKFQSTETQYAHALSPATKAVLNQGCDENGERTFTLVGTAEYLAPEFLVRDPGASQRATPSSNRVHGTEVDLWGIGILLYEMLVGHTPFAAENAEIHVTYSQILNSKVSFGTNFDREAKDIIKRLLKKKPAERLGCSAKGHVHDHAFLRLHFHKNAIFSRDLEAPWQPRVQSPLDVTLFNIADSEPPMCTTETPDADKQDYFSGFESVWPLV